MSKTGTDISYEYGESGIRSKKTVNGTATNYYYDGTQLVSMQKGSDRLWFRYDASGQLATITYNSNVHNVMRNAQGDVVGLVDNAGNVVVEYTYDAWGNPLSTTGTGASSVIAQMNPFRYRGYIWDSETGLYYLNQRYYNPQWGRFINADSLIGVTGKLLSHNMFAYCNNNPVMRSDPNGNFSSMCAGCPLLFKLELMADIKRSTRERSVRGKIDYISDKIKKDNSFADNLLVNKINSNYLSNPNTLLRNRESSMSLSSEIFGFVSATVLTLILPPAAGTIAGFALGLPPIIKGVVNQIELERGYNQGTIKDLPKGYYNNYEIAYSDGTPYTYPVIIHGMYAQSNAIFYSANALNECYMDSY